MGTLLMLEIFIDCCSELLAPLLASKIKEECYGCQMDRQGIFVYDQMAHNECMAGYDDQLIQNIGYIIRNCLSPDELRKTFRDRLFIELAARNGSAKKKGDDDDAEELEAIVDRDIIEFFTTDIFNQMQYDQLVQCKIAHRMLQRNSPTECSLRENTDKQFKTKYAYAMFPYPVWAGLDVSVHKRKKKTID